MVSKNVLPISCFAAALTLAAALCGCGGTGAQSGADGAAGVTGASVAQAETPITAASATIFADEREVFIKDASGLTVAQLLELAQVTLRDGDIITIDLNTELSGATLCVLHIMTVTVTDVDGRDNMVVLFGGTVADALTAAGIELQDDYILSISADTPLENGMSVVIEREVVEEETSYSGGSWNYTPPSSPGTSTPPPSSEPEPPARTVVSVQVYEDCDGSGHGVKVITYSAGTQEEIVF